MAFPLHITFRSMDPSTALEARIGELAQRLERFSSHIGRCNVVIEVPHKHGHKGHLYEVHIELTVPGGEVVASHEHRAKHSHEDVYVALRDAFNAVRRQLEDRERERRQDIKHHEPEPIGWISQLYPAEDFGRIETSDGRSLYFHRHSVIGADFDRLTTGTEVRFAEERGELGPQASTVKVVTHVGPVS